MSKSSTALGKAIIDHNHTALSDALNQKLDINANCHFKSTPIHLAIEKDNLIAIHALLTKGANTDLPNLSLDTPLINACKLNRTTAANIILKYKPDLYQKSSEGKYAIHYAAEHKNYRLVSEFFFYDFDLGKVGGASFLKRYNMENAYKHACKRQGKLYKEENAVELKLQPQKPETFLEYLKRNEALFLCITSAIIFTTSLILSIVLYPLIPAVLAFAIATTVLLAGFVPVAVVGVKAINEKMSGILEMPKVKDLINLESQRG
jgi:hypothetical protein